MFRRINVFAGLCVCACGMVLLAMWLIPEYMSDIIMVVPAYKTVQPKSDLPGWYDFVRNVPQIDQNRAFSNNTCDIPKLGLEHDENSRFYSKLGPLSCNGTRLFYMNKSQLKTNHTYLGNRQIRSCSYVEILRVSDWEYAYSSPVVRTEDYEVIVKADFFVVQCNITEPLVGNSMAIAPSGKSDENINVSQHQTNTSQSVSEVIFEKRSSPNGWFKSFSNLFKKKERSPITGSDTLQFFAQIHPKPDVLERIKKISPPPESTQMSVMILGLDSMSHLAYRRVMPLTYQYIKDKLSGVIMNAYNVVGDGTLAAFIPFLTGMTELELPDTRWGPLNDYVDVYPLIWKRFKKHGYVTLYGEDYPLIETFQMRMRGFQTCPVDHYMRAFWQAAFKHHPDLSDKGDATCFNGHGRHVEMLYYVKDLWIKYPNVPKFAFQWLTACTHADPNLAQYSDVDIRDMLKYLQDEGHLEDTLVIVMSDHGPRFGAYRQTSQGKLEERFPMMSFSFPNKFKQKYPQLIKNLEVNADRLATHFDFHETLQSVLDIRKVTEQTYNVTARGISVLQEIPNNRSCTDAGIQAHWCTCMESEALNLTSNGVKRLAEYTVFDLNNRTSQVRKHCHVLSLRRIIEVRLVHPNKQLLKFKGHTDFHLRHANFDTIINTDVVNYQVTLETLPNMGLYEATVQGNVADGSFQVLGEVSRINKYGDQPKCIIKDYPKLRKYCYCRQ